MFKGRLNSFKPIKESSLSYFVWKQLQQLLNLLIFVEIPFELFLYSDYQVFYSQTAIAIRSTVLFITALDMLVSFNIYYDALKFNDYNRKTSIAYYLTYYFAFDIIPLCILGITTYLILPPYIQFGYYLKLVPFFRTDQMVLDRILFQRKALVIYSTVRLILFVFFCFHFYGCLFYYMGYLSLINEVNSWINFDESWVGIIYQFPWLQRYIISTYYAVETLVTAGYGEITGLNWNQVIVADFVQISAAFLVLFTLNRIMMIKSYSIKQLEQHKIALMQLLRSNNINKEIEHQILLFFEQFSTFSNKRDLENENLAISRLPKLMHRKMMSEAYLNYLNRITWLQLFSRELQIDLCQYISEEFILPYVPVSQFFPLSHLFYIVKGQLVFQLNKVDVGLITTGQYFNSYYFLTNDHLNLEVVSKTFCQIAIIPQSHFLELLEKHPADKKTFKQLQIQIKLNSRYDLIGLQCFLCRSTTHHINNCHLINIKQALKSQLLQKFQMESSHQGRQKYDRKFRHVTLTNKRYPAKVFELKSAINMNIDRTLEFPKAQVLASLETEFPKAIVDVGLLINDKCVINLDPQLKLKISKKGLPTFQSTQQWYKRWKYFVYLLTFLMLLAIPLIFFYTQYYYLLYQMTVFFALRYFIACILLIDILIELRVSHRLSLEYTPKQIMLAYIRSTFLFDLVPLIITIKFCISGEREWLHFLIYLKVYPMYKDQKLFLETLNTNPRQKKLYLMLKMFIEIVYLNHFFACMFYFAGIYAYQNYPNMNTWLTTSQCNFGTVLEYGFAYKYILAAYWAINALTTVGYGDIVPVNVFEMLVCDFAMILAIMLVSVNIAAILQLSQLQTDNYFKAQERCIMKFIKHKQVSIELKRDIQAYLRMQFEYFGKRNVVIEEESLKLLPEYLQVLVLSEIYRGYFEAHWFQIFETNTINKLCLHIKEVFYCPGEIIYEDRKDYKDYPLYILKAGQITLAFILSKTVIRDIIYLNSGQVFGNYSFLTSQNRECAAISSGYSIAFCLEQANFLSVLQENKRDHTTFLQLRDEVTFQRKYHLINVNCYICEQYDHVVCECPLIRYYPKAEISLERLRRKIQDRKPYTRKPLKKRVIKTQIDVNNKI